MLNIRYRFVYISTGEVVSSSPNVQTVITKAGRIGYITDGKRVFYTNTMTDCKLQIAVNRHNGIWAYHDVDSFMDTESFSFKLKKFIKKMKKWLTVAIDFCKMTRIR